MTAIGVVARRRGLPAPRSAASALQRHRALDWALAAAWDTAGRGGRAQIIDLQLARRTPAAAESLVAHFHRLDATARSVLLERVDDLHSALRHLLNRPTAAADTPDRNRVADAQTTINALWLIEHSNAGTLAYLALPQLRHTDPAARKAATACLLGLAIGQHPPLTANGAADSSGATVEPDPRSTAAVAESLDQAVVQYATHLNPGALEAWVAQGPAAFAPDSPALVALNDPEHPAVPALRTLLKDAGTPAIRRGLVGLLGLPTLALAAVAGLRKTAEDGPAALSQVLHRQAHLLDLPAVRHGLARGGYPEGLWPAALSIGTANPECDALPAWAAALPGSPREVLARLGPLTASGPAARRLDALRRTLNVANPRDPATAERSAKQTIEPVFRHALHAVLAPLCADPNPMLAAPAAAYLLRERSSTQRPYPPPGHRFKAPGRPSPDTQNNTPAPRPSAIHSRRAAARRVAATAFEPLWHAWTLVPTTQRRRAAAAALRLDATARERLRYATTAYDGEVRTRAHAILDAVDTDRDHLAPALHGTVL